MMRRDATSTLKEFVLDQGADMVGISSTESYHAAPKGHRPGDILAGARSVVAIAVLLPSASFENAPSRQYSISYMKANDELNRIAFSTARFLEGKGYRALHVPASPPYDAERNMGDLSHRHAAVLCGLGVLGKNSLLLTPKYGPRVRLVSVITDAPLRPDDRIEIDLCGKCTQCIKSCPAKALRGRGVVDKPGCENQHTIIGRRLQLSEQEQVCGICIRVCPVGKTK